MKMSKDYKTIILTILLVMITSMNNIVIANDNVGLIEGIIAESAIVMDMDTGEVIATKNADKKMPVASTIKLLTALIFAENTSKTEMIPFTENALKTTITSLNKFKEIKPGDEISSEDLMKSVLLFSANDAAYLMADSIDGNAPKFIQMMNDRIKSLGLTNTTIVNPSGLESDAVNKDNKEINISTAYDMAVIAKEAYKNEWVREILSEKYKNTSVDLSGSPVIIETRNKLLGKFGNIGGKTGNETKAGRCFVGYFERDGRNLITVALKSVYGADDVDVFNDTKEIADNGYSATKEALKNSGDVIDTVNLEYKLFGLFGPQKTINAQIKAVDTIKYYKNDINDKSISIEYNAEENNAWKLAGDDVELTMTLPNYTTKVKGEVDISIFNLIKINIVPYTIAVVSIAAFGLVIYKNISSKKKQKNKYV